MNDSLVNQVRLFSAEKKANVDGFGVGVGAEVLFDLSLDFLVSGGSKVRPVPRAFSMRLSANVRRFLELQALAGSLRSFFISFTFPFLPFIDHNADREGDNRRAPLVVGRSRMAFFDSDLAFALP
jgi:hypothetical protein